MHGLGAFLHVQGDRGPKCKSQFIATGVGTGEGLFSVFQYSAGGSTWRVSSAEDVVVSVCLNRVSKRAERGRRDPSADGRIWFLGRNSDVGGPVGILVYRGNMLRIQPQPLIVYCWE